MNKKVYITNNLKRGGANVCAAGAVLCMPDMLYMSLPLRHQIKRPRGMRVLKRSHFMNLVKRFGIRVNDQKSALKRLFCLSVMLIVLCASLHTQERRRLSPDEAVELAIKNNLSLETSRTNAATKERASRYSWNQFIPNVTVAGSVMRDNQASTASGLYPVDLAQALNPIYEGLNQLGQALNPFAPPSSSIPLLPEGALYGVTPYSVEISPWRVATTIQASINLNLAMFENMKRLQLDYETGLLGYEKVKIQLERDVRKAYHNMLLIQERISLLRSSFANVERQVQMAQANYNAGLAPELTLLQAQVARENMRPYINQAENGMRLSMAQFAMFLGLDYNTQFELIPVAQITNFIRFDIPEMVRRAYDGKPDIKELRHTIMMLESARKAQIYALTPSLTISWNRNSAFLDPWNNPWFESRDNWMKSGSLTVSLGIRLHSLIPFSADYQGIKNTDDQIKTANLGLTQLINGTEIEIYNIILGLEGTRTSAQAQTQTVNLAEQAYRQTEQAYRAGLQDYFQVQSAEQSLREARVQMLEQQFNYINGLIDLEYSIGVPFGTLSGRRF
jgi:outer membrane protein TolC